MFKLYTLATNLDMNTIVVVTDSLQLVDYNIYVEHVYFHNPEIDFQLNEVNKILC